MTKTSPNPEKTLKIPRIIILIGKICAFFSPKLATLYAAKLFTTPIKYKIPKRELDMDRNSVQKLVHIPTIDRQVVLYHYGKNEPKVLLVHGWSGRGTQLVKIADELLKFGYSTISFDAPAHGKSSGNSTIMVDFIAAILELDRQFGPFEAAIGHSLGGMSVLNAVKSGLKINRIAIIGSGDIVQDIIDDFIEKLELKPSMATSLRFHFEKKYGGNMDDYSAYKAAQEITIPALIIHDQNDYEVPVKAGIHIHKYLKNSELVITKGLGHRKILGNQKVVEKIVRFISNK